MYPGRTDTFEWNLVFCTCVINVRARLPIQDYLRPTDTVGTVTKCAKDAASDVRADMHWKLDTVNGNSHCRPLFGVS